MIAAVAGTFDVVHEGHLRLLDRAFEVGDEVLVGLTSDRFAGLSRDEVVPLQLRRAELERVLSGRRKPWRIVVIDDARGPSEEMDAADVLVVSEETVPGGGAVNDYRARRGVPPLELSVVPLEMADDGEKISASRILRGDYGRKGSSEALDVAVGSLNRVKVEAVRAVMERIYGDVRVTAVDAPSGVPEQPFEGLTRAGAVNRARAALGGHELSVGIEAGVFEREPGLYDVQCCAVLDRDGRLTVGAGPAFMYPPRIAALVRAGRTVGEAVSEVFGEDGAGKRQGAVGILSKGLLDRKTLTEQAVVAAMIPRLDPSYVERFPDFLRGVGTSFPLNLSITTDGFHGCRPRRTRNRSLVDTASSR